MITELIVTSAPRGLQAGRSGFTTVMRTRGIHPDLAIRLEAASGYRHTYPQGDPRNPIVFSYTNMPSAAGDGWVLSRVGDAGTDYTGRSNKIAHHIALKPEDVGRLAISNPALVLAALAGSGGFKTVWQGEPMESPTPPAVPIPPSQPGVCERWRAAASDPGWAGVLVERALNKETTWVIAPPGTDVLGLFAEALALAGPAQRWQIPFTTYSLNRNEGRWLGTLSGTPEAEAARKQPRVLVIDLANPGLPPTAGPYVLAARGLAAPPWVKLHSPQERVVAPQPTAGTASIQSTAGTHSGMQMRPEMVPPPIHAQPALPPALKQWPGSLPEPSRPWYASAVALCIAGIALLVAVGLTMHGRVFRRSAVLQPNTDAVTQNDAVPSGDGSTPPAGVSGGRNTTATETATSKPPTGFPSAQGRDSKEKKGNVDDAPALKPPMDRNNRQADAPPPLVPAVLKLILEEAADHTTITALPMCEEKRETQESLLLLKWASDGGDLANVMLDLPSAKGMSEKPYVLKEQEMSTASNSRPEIIWNVYRSGALSDAIGFFTVSSRSVTFTPGIDYSTKANTLPLWPLVIQDAKAITPPAWVRLHSALQREVFVSASDGQQFTRLFPADEQERAVLVKSLQVSDVALHFPEGIEGQCYSDEQDVAFGVTLKWAPGDKDLRFRWRPSSWGRESGAWLDGSLSIAPSHDGSFVGLSTNLGLSRAAEVVEVALAPNSHDLSRFMNLAVDNKDVSIDLWSRVLPPVAFAYMKAGEFRSEKHGSKTTKQILFNHIKGLWGELDSLTKDEWDSLCIEVGISRKTFSRDEQKQDAAKMRVKEWCDYLRDYLMAYRVSETATSDTPPEQPKGDPPLEAKAKAEFEEKERRWREYARGLKLKLRPGDDEAFHRWCEEVCAKESTEHIAVVDMARLWVLLSAFAQDVRQEVRADDLRRRMQPRVSGVVSIAWQGPRESIDLTTVELKDGLGRLGEVFENTQADASRIDGDAPKSDDGETSDTDASSVSEAPAAASDQGESAVGLPSAEESMQGQGAIR